MADLKLAAQRALFAALDVSAVTGSAAGLTVWQHTPDDQQPPVVVLGEMSAENVGGKDGGFDRIDFEVLSLVRAPGREFLTPVMTAVRGAVEGAALVSATAILSPPVFESDDDEILEEDGSNVTYMGRQRFSLFAQPLDE